MENRSNHPVRLEEAVTNLLDTWSKDGSSSQINARIVRIHAMYREVIEKIYRNTAQHMLDHTNSVYIVENEKGRVLIAYLDESIFAADLNAQRELVKLLFLELFNEKLDIFDIYVSKGKYRKNHPFSVEGPAASPRKHVLTEEEKAWIDASAAQIEEETLRCEMKKAMIATLEWGRE